MKKVLIAVLMLLISTPWAYAQRISRVESGLDVGASFGEGQWAPSFLYYQALHPANAPWVEINGGVRGWSYFTNDARLTAPAGASRNDQMLLSRVSVTGASIVLGANLKLASKVAIGFNADVFSFAFGKRRNAIYRLAAPLVAPDSISDLNGKEIGIAPANLNIVPAFVKKNNGQAEVFVRVWVGKQFGIKAGYVWGQVAYRSDVSLNKGQRRFSSTYQMPYLALSFPLSN
jgi:hypothetical protein